MLLQLSSADRMLLPAPEDQESNGDPRNLFRLAQTWPLEDDDGDTSDSRYI